MEELKTWHQKPGEKGVVFLDRCVAERRKIKGEMSEKAWKRLDGDMQMSEKV